MNDARQVLAEHLPELALDLLLDELLDNSDRVEGAVDIDVLERVGLEDERDALLFGYDEDDVRIEPEVGKAEEHGDDEGLLGGEHAAGAAHEVYLVLLMVQRVRLPRECRAGVCLDEKKSRKRYHVRWARDMNITSEEYAPEPSCVTRDARPGHMLAEIFHETDRWSSPRYRESQARAAAKGVAVSVSGSVS